ncbi:beta-CASP ribonuclease aCPSF1 [Candidatus Hecatella orcuttiae]|uniref:beta-CASP ribonuclease aCPSF1 n=1 Tax=Candidatus Hecatella orcuttiae TaxID=1935119 RepID=UPI0028680BFD|nr:beta-CASP ribonuclease aCPSF1 [Candidatus Hecatella orcuttiae]
MNREEIQSKIRQVILQHVPKEAEVSRIEFEGPRLAIYTKKPEILLDQSYIVTDIVNLIRKRITLRSDPSIRMPEKEAERFILSAVPPEAEITSITFDHSLGEVIIEAKKPGLVISKNGYMLHEIIKATKWRPRVLRTPPIPSKIIAHIRHYMHKEVKDRERILRSVGERIFRPTFSKTQEVLLTPLGGCRQVGRSAYILRTRESSILIDCGINPASTNPEDAFPRLDINEFDLENLDAVVISHAHLDHCGLLPLLYKYGYDGPVYCSEPTLSLMSLLQLDYLDVLSREGALLPYSQKDVRETVLHAIPLKYGVVTDVAPDVKLTLHNAGHILGSSVIHIHVGEGLHNIVYTGDFKFLRTMLLEASATTFPRIETLIMESTYGAPGDVMPYRGEVESKLANVVDETLRRGGKVLIPVLAVGRAQEIMLVLNEYLRAGMIPEVPIFVDGMINEVTAIHTAYPEYLSKELQSKILYEDVNPFQSDYFVTIKHASSRSEAMEGPPCVILATSGMLEGGPILEYFKQLASDEKNTLIFVCYQIDGTLGRRIQNGLKDVAMMNAEGKVEMVNVRLRVESIEGFSGHSDRNQLLNFIKRVSPKPQRIIICHGEKSKCLSLSNSIERMFKIESLAPENLETLRLC